MITAVDTSVSMTSRTVALQATLPNEGEKLRAGLFVRISIIFSKSEEVVQIPGSSVQYAPYGDSVYVIEKMKDPKGAEYLGARPQVVTLGRRRGDQISVLSGLKGEEQVVSSGAFKLRPGVAVLVDNSTAPDNEPNPHPPDT